MAESHLRDNETLKKIKKWVGIGASIGGAALAGCALKKVDSSTAKGLGKILIPLGVFGLASAAGDIAEKGAKRQIDAYADTVEILGDFVREANVDVNNYEDEESDLHLVDAD